MKKILALALVMMMVLSLAACGGKTDPAPSGSSTTDPGTSQQTSEPEESNTEKTGNEASEWPNNEFTKAVPKPSFQVVSASGSDSLGMFTIGFNGVSNDDIKEYTEQVKAAGFDDGTIFEDSGTGYYWQSKSSDGGIAVELQWEEGGKASIFFSKN